MLDAVGHGGLDIGAVVVPKARCKEGGNEIFTCSQVFEEEDFVVAPKDCRFFPNKNRRGGGGVSGTGTQAQNTRTSQPRTKEITRSKRRGVCGVSAERKRHLLSPKQNCITNCTC